MRCDNLFISFFSSSCICCVLPLSLSLSLISSLNSYSSNSSLLFFILSLRPFIFRHSRGACCRCAGWHQRLYFTVRIYGSPFYCRLISPHFPLLLPVLFFIIPSLLFAPFPFFHLHTHLTPRSLSLSLSLSPHSHSPLTHTFTLNFYASPCQASSRRPVTCGHLVLWCVNSSPSASSPCANSPIYK